MAQSSRPKKGGGVNAGGGMNAGGGINFGGGSIYETPSMMPQLGGFSTADMIMHRGMAGQSGVTDPTTGLRLSTSEAAARGPFTIPGWKTSGVGPGSPGYRGSGRIGSAAGALGSGGTPTSQRGRFEKFASLFGEQAGENAAEMPSYMASQAMREAFGGSGGGGGLGMSWRYGGQMGALPYSPAPMDAPATAQNATQQAPVIPQPSMSAAAVMPPAGTVAAPQGMMQQPTPWSPQNSVNSWSQAPSATMSPQGTSVQPFAPSWKQKSWFNPFSL